MPALQVRHRSQRCRAWLVRTVTLGRARAPRVLRAFTAPPLHRQTSHAPGSAQRGTTAPLGPAPPPHTLARRASTATPALRSAPTAAQGTRAWRDRHRRRRTCVPRDSGAALVRVPAPPAPPGTTVRCLGRPHRRRRSTAAHRGTPARKGRATARRGHVPLGTPAPAGPALLPRTCATPARR